MFCYNARMSNDTIRARMETIRELTAKLFPKGPNNKDREDGSYPCVTLVFSYPEDQDDHYEEGFEELGEGQVTDMSTGAWKACIYASFPDDYDLPNLGSRGDSPERALDLVLMQLKEIAKPLLDAIEAAEKAGTTAAVVTMSPEPQEAR
jgi:hypothetical protein